MSYVIGGIQSSLAVAELERVVKDYGFTAVEIGASVNGRNYDEPEFDPFFQRAAELDVLIFVHPSSPPGPERMRRYYTQNIIGFPVETAICAAALIFGGVFARYPNIKVCLAHGGGMTSSLVGRWDHGWEARAEASQAIDRPPSEYLKLLYFDDLVHSDRPFLNSSEPSPIGGFRSMGEGHENGRGAQAEAPAAFHRLGARRPRALAGGRVSRRGDRPRCAGDRSHAGTC